MSNQTNVEKEKDRVSKPKESLVKLPALEILNCYGYLWSWILFKELFQYSILSNNSLSKIQKFQCLQACVKGRAFKMKRDFPLEEQILQHCWEILHNRFKNKLQLAISQLNKVLKLTKMQHHKLAF